MNPVVVPVDSVLTLDTSYRRRPTKNEVAIFTLRRRFNRPQAVGAARFYVHWEDAAITALAQLGYTMVHAFWTDYGEEQRMLQVIKDDVKYLLIYDLPELREEGASRIRTKPTLLDHLSS